MKTKKIAMLGAGQLGGMMQWFAKKHGAEISALDPAEEPPVIFMGESSHIQGDFRNTPEVLAHAQGADVVTCELEHVSVGGLQAAKKADIPCYPSSNTIGIIQNKRLQKERLSNNRFPTTIFRPVVDVTDMSSFGTAHGYPFLLKAACGSYDGTGNFTVHSSDELEAAFDRFPGREVYAEAFVPFEKEIAVVGVRDQYGTIATYDPVQTIHKDHICHEVMMGDLDLEVAEKARGLAYSVIDHFKDVGIMTIEMFLTKDGGLLVNEIAPRVHNSGHLTLGGAYNISQFEQHVRVILGKHLVHPRAQFGYAGMINILGREGGKDWDPIVQDIQRSLSRRSRGQIILYNKTHRVGRKLGHIILFGNESLEPIMKELRVLRKSIRM